MFMPFPRVFLKKIIELDLAGIETLLAAPLSARIILGLPSTDANTEQWVLEIQS